MSKIDDFGLLPREGKDCIRCLDLVLKIRHGEIKGVVLSCHPLDQIADEDLAKFIESRELTPN